MHTSTIVTLLLPLGLLPLGFAAPTAPEVSALIFDGPHPINYTQTTDQHPYDPNDDTIHALANCYGGGDINTGDIGALADNLQNRGGNRYLPSNSWVSTTVGSAKACVYNNYIFENTHVDNWEMGWGVRSVKDQCCFTPFCGGGLQQGHGDTKLAVNIVTRSAGIAC
jgi:hypothetical protein